MMCKVAITNKLLKTQSWIFQWGERQAKHEVHTSIQCQLQHDPKSSKMEAGVKLLTDHEQKIHQTSENFKIKTVFHDIHIAALLFKINS